jgi:gamma-glutamylcyclotransferase (GGCT)/AIG2-like uncharacterized protein YtfP
LDTPVPQDDAPSRLAQFFYGTLKRGQCNHDRFCQGVAWIESATTLGHLYELPFGFPGLRVYGRDVRAVGTTNYLADAEKQRVAPPAPLASTPTWDIVHGELMTFEDPEKRLIAFDALEGYTPGEESLYERVLIPVEVPGKTLLVWAYQLKRPIGVYLPGGRWPS